MTDSYTKFNNNRKRSSESGYGVWKRSTTLETSNVLLPDKSVSTIFSCGGGKDSLVAMKLLEDIDEPYTVAQYSHSVYGEFEQQQELIDDLVEHTKARKQHKMTVIEDFLDSPTLSSHYKHKISTVYAPETPCGVFEMLPIMLA